LDLEGTNVGPAGACFLFPALTHLTAMTYLKLGYTYLESSGVSQLCSALRHLTFLNCLELYEIGLHSSGVSYLCSAFNHLTSLTQFRFSDSILTVNDVALIFWAAAASGLPRLKTLHLAKSFPNGNYFSAVDVFGCSAWMQLNLPHPPRRILRMIQAYPQCRNSDLNYAPIVSFLSSNHWNTMSLVLNAAAARPIYGPRSVNAHYLQPPAQLGFIISRRMLDLASLHLWFRDNTHRMKMLSCCCPLAIVAFRLSRAAVSYQGHHSFHHRVISLIMKKCLSGVAWRFWRDIASDGCCDTVQLAQKRFRED